MIWVWVSMPHATFALGARDGVVCYVPPIARWAMGKPLGMVMGYYLLRGATIRPLDGAREEGWSAIPPRR